MPLVTLGFVLVFGGLTLWLHDELFIKMKPTIVNCIFGTALLGGLLFGKSLLAYVFDAAFKLDEEGWRKLTLRFGLLFFALALLNEIVWRNFSTDFWVGFKTWAVMPLTMLFMLTQLSLIQRHTLPEARDGEPAKGDPR
jgi:intracellular septation protein